MYKVTAKSQDILLTTTIPPDTAGGWLAINIGTDSVSIDGYTITPGEGLDFTNLHPEVVWNSEIKIILTSTNSKVRLTRLYYTKL